MFHLAKKPSWNKVERRNMRTPRQGKSYRYYAESKKITPAKDMCDRCAEPGTLAIVRDRLGERFVRLCSEHFDERRGVLANQGCELRR